MRNHWLKNVLVLNIDFQEDLLGDTLKEKFEGLYVIMRITEGRVGPISEIWAGEDAGNWFDCSCYMNAQYIGNLRKYDYILGPLYVDDTMNSHTIKIVHDGRRKTIIRIFNMIY